MLTGDGKLRKQAAKDGLEVRGILFIFDELLKQELIGFKVAIEKIATLYQLNNRLPEKEIDKCIESCGDENTLTNSLSVRKAFTSCLFIILCGSVTINIQF